MLNNLFDLSYKLVNLTQEKLNLKLSLGSCPHIYLTGDTDLSLKMEPESVYLHEVKGLAAKIGLFELPTVKVISKIANTGREELVNASHQQYILVRAPIAKKTPAKNLPDMDLC